MQHAAPSRLRNAFAALAAGLLFAACSASGSTAPDCETAVDCARGQTCLAGACVEGAIDTGSEDTAADTRGQTAEVLAIIDRLLAQAGSDKSKLLSVVIFITDMRDKPQVDAAWLAWADPQAVPARAVLEARLLNAETRVEMVCVGAR